MYFREYVIRTSFSILTTFNKKVNKRTQECLLIHKKFKIHPGKKRGFKPLKPLFPQKT